MNDTDKESLYSECRIENSEAEDFLKGISDDEQVYTIALFDILGFSNFVQSNGNLVILELYNKLIDIVNKQKSTFDGESSYAGSVAPVPISNDWKSAVYMANASGFVNVSHFSDTFIIYVNYRLRKQGGWLANGKTEPYPLLSAEIGTPYYPIIYERHHIYLSFLQTCMEFFCQAIVAGIPLRGCVSTGLAIMNPHKSIYLGNPLVEAARGETAQNALGIAFGQSFNNSHPVYNDYFIPYLSHIKESSNSTFLSPMVLDWAKYWRTTPDFKEYNFKDCIDKMNTDSRFSSYYNNAINFFEFSAKHSNWSHEINREGIKDITDFYDKSKEWFNTVK